MIWYVDFESGDDANGGSSFTVIRSGAAGVLSGTTLTDAGASFDSTEIGHVIKLAGLGRFSVTARPSSTTLTLAAISGGTALSNGTRAYVVGGRAKTTLTSNTGLTSTEVNGGDTLRYKASKPPANVGVNGTWTSVTVAGTFDNTNRVVTLSAAVTKTIYNVEADWTAKSANITSTLTATRRRGDNSVFRVNVAAGFTTGKACYYTLPSTLDLSTYTRICLWVQADTVSAMGTGASPAYSIRLCTDTIGDTSVHTIPLNSINDIGATGASAIITANRWTPVVWDNAGALNSAIKSVAVYCDSDQGAVNILIANIFAALADADGALTLTSMIGSSNSTGCGGDDSEPWWAIAALDETTVWLDTALTGTSTSLRGYYGTSSTRVLWKREPIRVTTVAVNTGWLGLMQSGLGGAAPASAVTHLFGCNRTDMSTITDATWIDGSGHGSGQEGTGSGTYIVSGIGFVRFDVGANNKGMIQSSWSCDGIVNCVSNGLRDDGSMGTGITIVCKHIVQCATGLSTQLKCDWGIITIKKIIGCTSTGVSLTSGADFWIDLIANSATAIANTVIPNTRIFRPRFKNTTFTLNVVDLTRGGSGGSGWYYLDTPTFTSGTPVATNGGGAIIKNLNGVIGTHRAYLPDVNGPSQCDTETIVVHSTGGTSWKVLLNLSMTYTDTYPMIFPLGYIVCKANQNVTANGWFRRTNVALTVKLVAPALQLSGMPTNTSASMAAAINTWEQLTINFTPTEDGIVYFEMQIYGSASTAYVDDIVVIGGESRVNLMGLEKSPVGLPMLSNQALEGLKGYGFLSGGLQ